MIDNRHKPNMEQIPGPGKYSTKLQKCPRSVQKGSENTTPENGVIPGCEKRGLFAQIKLEDIIRKKVKKNLVTSTGGKNPQPLEISPKPVNTRIELSKVANVSHDKRVFLKCICILTI